MLDMAVIKEDDQKANESFDDVVKRVYQHINDVQNKNRKLQYESILPYYTPFGQNDSYYIPLGDKSIPGGEKMDHFSYDANQNRFSLIYNNYYRMLNKNLQFLSNIQKYQYDSDDSRFKQLDNPESFEYDHYFDGFNDHETMSQSLPILYHKKNAQKQEDNHEDEQEDMHEENNHEGEQHVLERKLQQVATKETLQQLQRRLKQINKDEKKLLKKQKYLESMKNFYEKNYPEIINKIGLLNS